MPAHSSPRSQVTARARCAYHDFPIQAEKLLVCFPAGALEHILLQSYGSVVIQSKEGSFMRTKVNSPFIHANRCDAPDDEVMLLLLLLLLLRLFVCLFAAGAQSG
jgi:hypothetical protein